MRSTAGIDAMRRARLSGPTGRAICAYLAVSKGSRAQIAEVIGCSYKAVECAVRVLRKDESPLLENVLDGRNLRTFQRQPVKQKPNEPQYVAEDLRAKAVATVASALRSRTPLEDAWR